VETIVNNTKCHLKFTKHVADGQT